MVLFRFLFKYSYILMCVVLARTTVCWRHALFVCRSSILPVQGSTTTTKRKEGRSVFSIQRIYMFETIAVCCVWKYYFKSSLLDCNRAATGGVPHLSLCLSQKWLLCLNDSLGTIFNLRILHSSRGLNRDAHQHLLAEEVLQCEVELSRESAFR